MLDAFGRHVSFSYDSQSRMTKAVDPAGSAYLYGYDGIGNTVSVTYPDGGVRGYTYNEPVNINGGTACPYETAGFPRMLTGLTDNGLRFADFKYACDGRAVSTEHVGGVYKYSFVYSGGVTSVTDPLDAVRSWTFSNILDVVKLTAASQPSGAGYAASTSNQGFDANGNVASRDDFNGKRVCYANDLSRNLETSRVEGLSTSATCSAVTLVSAALPTGSRKASTEWHPDWRLPTRVAEPGRITTSIYNGQPDPFNGGALASCAPSTAQLPDGKPIAVLCKQVEQATTDTDGHLGFSAALQSGVASRQTIWTYNQYGQVLSEDGPRTDVNDITTYAYYSDASFTGSGAAAEGHFMGDLQSVTNAVGKVTSFSKYNKHGQVLESSDANGVLSVNTYDLRQRLLSSTVGGQTTSYSYDAAGQLKKVTLPDTSWVGYDYDDAHRQVAVYDNKGNRTEYVLDNAGNRTGENTKDPNGALKRQLSRSIDALGRVQQTTGRE
jgi:YD repeat-containing protein